MRAAAFCFGRTILYWDTVLLALAALACALALCAAFRAVGGRARTLVLLLPLGTLLSFALARLLYFYCHSEQYASLSAVLADSFARIFFRNAVNLGLLPIVCRGISARVSPGQTLTVDLEKGTVTVHETGEEIPCERLGDQAMKILEAGGIKPLMRARFGKD